MKAWISYDKLYIDGVPVRPDSSTSNNSSGSRKQVLPEAEIKVLSWNVQGLTNIKINDEDFLNYIRKFDIILFFESWANNSACYDIDGFKCYPFNRKIQNKKSKRSSGGIAIYIKQSITKGISIVKNYQDAIVWLKLDKLYFNLTEDIFLASVYIWPENSPMYNIFNVNI